MASKILKEVLGRVETWPEERQNDAAHVLIEMEQQDAHSIGLTLSGQRGRTPPCQTEQEIRYARNRSSPGCAAARGLDELDLRLA